MNVKHIKSQTELDSFSKDSLEMISIEFGTPDVPAKINNEYKMPLIIGGNYCAEVYGKNTVLCCDKAIVVAYNEATVNSLNESSVVAFNESKVYARDKSHVEGYDLSAIAIYDDATYLPMDKSIVKLYKDPSKQLSDLISGAKEEANKYNASLINEIKKDDIER